MNKLQILNTKRFKKAYAAGGTPNPNDPNQTQGLSSAIGAAGTIVGSVADAMDTGNSHGRQRGITVGLHQGATLAAAGATLGGPIGAAVGGGIGLAEGLISSIGAKKAEAAEDRNQNYEDQLSSQQAGNARIASDPNLKYGNASAQNFAGGGQLPDTTKAPPLSKKYRGEWNGFVDWMGKSGNAADPNLDVHTKTTGVDYLNQYRAANHTTQLSPDSISRTQQELQDYKNTTWGKIQAGKVQSDAKTYGQYMPNLSPVDGWLGSKTANEMFPSVIENGKSLGYANPNVVGTASPKPAYAKGGDIHIKPSHEGRFTAYKKSTGKTTEEALHSKDPHVRKMANFAKNAAGWKKEDGGTIKLGDGGTAPKPAPPDPKTLASVKGFYNDYLNSPNYKARLVGQGYKNPDEVISDRKFNVNRANVRNLTSNLTPKGYVGSNYNFGSNMVTIDNVDKKVYPVDNADLYAHEFGHAAGAIATPYPSPYTMNFADQKLINQKNKLANYNGKNPEMIHDAQPDELKADMDDIRYKLKQNGIYDTGTQTFNQDYLNKAKQKLGGDGNFIRLKQRLSDADFIQLMNKVATNTPNQQAPASGPAPTPTTAMAKFGGRIKAFGNGGQMDNLPPTQQVPGGSLSPMNSQAVQVNGDSHAQGGVQLPSAEVEGGETIANGFVFSKEMGFADLHKPIAKAIGKIEAKPIDPIRRKTMSILKGRELGLAMAQESIKHKMGMPSDLTGGQ